MRVIIVSTYPPRMCGIATFAHDVHTAMVEADPSVQVGVVSVVRPEMPARAMAGVVHTVRQDVLADYVQAGAVIESWGADVVLIEHEYGIFGGDSGSHVVALARGLRVPVMVTLHTVLSEPTVGQSSVLAELCACAALVTVFTDTARRMVVAAGLVDRDRVVVVPHGAPAILGGGGSRADRPPSPVCRALARSLQGRTVLSTFGLISAGKGIETAVASLPTIARRHPRVLYLVAGQTHPDVVAREGERYRRSLERLVIDLGLQRHVCFMDRFLSVPELAWLLACTDVYLTPYRSREQIVSGALTFAVAAGCPVVSTPYFYAEDLLASGAGVIVPFGDRVAFTDAVLRLLDVPQERHNAAAEARRVGGNLGWPAVAAHTVRVLKAAVAAAARPPAAAAPR